MEMLKMGIPFYETVAGQKMPVGTMDHEDMQLCIYNTTVEECRAYAKSLEEAGFVQYDAKEISAGQKHRIL